MVVQWGFIKGGSFRGENIIKELLQSIFPTESENYPELSVSLSGTGFFCVCLGLAIKV